MTIITMIDTLQFSKRMQKAGFEQKAADELADAIKEMESQSIENLATKKDLEILEQGILIKIGKMIYISTALIITIIGVAVAIIKI